jgi:hypothetical protein
MVKAPSNGRLPQDSTVTPTGSCWPGKRPSGSAVATSPRRLHLSLLRDLQRVVDLDPEVSHCAFQLRVPKQQLNCSEIPRPPVDQRRFGTSQRMRSIRRCIEPNRPHPGPDDPGILPGRKMGRLCNAAWKEELLRLQMRRADLSRNRIARLLGDLKLHRPLRLLLHDNRAGGDMTALDHIVDAKSD